MSKAEQLALEIAAGASGNAHLPAGAMTHINNNSNNSILAQDDNEYGLKEGEVSSGTTIMAIVTEHGVVMGADSRVTTGSYVTQRVSDKIVALTDHIFCARSGSAADTQAVSDYVRFYLQQLAIEMGRPPRVKTAAHLVRNLCYENKDLLLAGMIVGGWDPVDGPSVYQITLGSSCYRAPFALGGSGSGYIYGLMDASYQSTMSLDDARTLVKKLLAHAMARDGGSGGCIRTVVITPDGFDKDFTPGQSLPFLLGQVQ